MPRKAVQKEELGSIYPKVDLPKWLRDPVDIEEDYQF